MIPACDRSIDILGSPKVPGRRFLAIETPGHRSYERHTYHYQLVMRVVDHAVIIRACSNKRCEVATFFRTFDVVVG